jgi:Asp-tRNA(Asn)/Glu-tRNA(Gln) amidotransferase A subunit family amidase
MREGDHDAMGVAMDNMNSVFLSAKRLAHAIKACEMPATAVLDAHLAQIDKHHESLNAVVTLDAERAHQRAHQADEALARGALWGPLHGVPFTLKDAFSTAGLRTTVGFPSWADYVPAEDSTIAARLKRAAAILIAGRSDLSGLCWRARAGVGAAHPGDRADPERQRFLTDWEHRPP